MLEDRVNKYADKTFLFSECDGRSWTYSQFDKAVNRTSNLLLANGAGKGDVVSLLLPNSAEYIIAYFACFKIGAVAGPVNSLLKAEEIEWVVSNSESKLLLTTSDRRLSADIPEGRSLTVREGSDASTLSTTPSANHPGRKAGHPSSNQEGSQNATPPKQGGEFDVPPIIVFDEVDAATEDLSDSLDEVHLNLDDDAIIIYTSGTTGKPKGCLLTHGNLIANAKQITEWLGFGEDDRLLTIMPLFHMNAVSVTTMTALYAGGSTVVSPKFSASRFWEIIEKYQITSFGSVATMLSMLLAASDQQSAASSQRTDSPFTIHHSPLSSLRFAMCGSAPVPAEILKRFEETFGCLVIEGYGLSESTCRSTFNPPNENRRPGSCGKPIGNEMKVFDENDEEVNDGALGEIVMRGENIFKSYFNNPDATEKAFANGWFHTGDIGYRDTDSFFYIADRKSDMIIRGGENIYPREIDDLLYSHPAVEAAAVIGVPDELYGEEVAAFVVLKDGEKISEAGLIDFCKQHLADFKCPKTVHFVDDIPKGPTGKLLKRELASLFTDRQT